MLELLCKEERRREEEEEEEEEEDMDFSMEVWVFMD